MRKTAALLTTLLALGAPIGPVAEADPITDQIDAGRRAYEAGEARVAIQALQFAVAEIEAQLREQQLKLLPEPLPGWTAEGAASKSEGLAAMIAGTSLSRSYIETDTGAELTITITADSPLLAMMGMMMTTPMLMQAQPGSSPYSYDSFRGMLETDDAGSAKITLMVGTRILLQLEGTDGADRDDLEAYLDAMDLANLERALLG
ncbi:MAG: hypothetical protein PVH47_03830 [Thiohalocapsa sp.]|jgi:hypothetical protein